MGAAFDFYHTSYVHAPGVAQVTDTEQTPSGHCRNGMDGPPGRPPGAVRRLAQVLRPARTPLLIILTAAIYGFSGGSIDGLRGASRNLIKFPLLIFLTGALCAPAWWLIARFLSFGLSFRAAISNSLETFADASLMLAALAPVNLFLSRTMVLPTRDSLNEYPLFLGLNVTFVAVCGIAAVVRRLRLLQITQGVSFLRASGLMTAWLAIGLFVGGQCSWYLRPFYGNPAIEQMEFILGTNPDSWGATSIYEAAYHILRPPPLPKDYWRWGGANR
jgi:hypothetical protein